MNLEFVNREAELKELDAVAAQGGVLALYGRRRVGKTRLLIEWLKRRDGRYSQAIGTLTSAQKQRLIHEHASTVFEDFCRQRHPGAQRYWEGDVELDLVAPVPVAPKELIVAEVKWRRLTAAERAKVLR